MENEKSNWNPDRIQLVIEVIMREFEDVYLTSRYFGESSNPRQRIFELFTEGRCGIVGTMIKEVIPEAEYYRLDGMHNGEKVKHIVMKIDSDYYDVNGFVRPDFLAGKTLTPISLTEVVSAFYPLDYFDKPDFYETMIQTCSEAGKQYVIEREWGSKGKKIA